MSPYATTQQFSERSGLGTRVIDESVGTSAGGSGTQSFDLDNDNIITGTYTISSGTATESLSNQFTALTETTHYTLDKESGRVLLSGSGSEFVNADILYATYTYIEDFTDATISTLLTNADNQVDKLTGRNWGTGTTRTEYQDGRRDMNREYPTTDRPFAADWDQPDQLILNKWPVSKIDHIHFLTNPLVVSKFYNYSGTAATYTDKTDDVNSSLEAPFVLFDPNPSTDDIIYVGSSLPFLGMDVNLGTDGSGTSAVDWEYYNGSDWADITETDTDTGASTFTTSGKFTWSYPYGWAQNSVNSNTLYWIRGTLSDGYTVDPQVATITIEDGVNTTLEPRQISFKDNGIVNILGVKVQDGQKNIRIDYTYGLSVTPSYITELSILLASEQAFLNITGSSYDEATGYTLGTKSLQIGEAWVNVKQVLQEIRIKIKSILDMIGSRGDIKVI